MNWKRSLTLLLLAVGLLVGVFNVGPISRSTNAQSTASSSESWEYCAIVRVADYSDSSAHMPYARVCYFQSSEGCRYSNIELPPGRFSAGGFGSPDYDEVVLPIAWANAVAILGQDRWEMIGEITGADADVGEIKGTDTDVRYPSFSRSVYFKRRPLTK